MDWVGLIPTSLLQLGGLLLPLGYALVFLDVPGKGVPWDKIGAGFSAFGGFGVGGAAGGAIGSALATGADVTQTTAQRLGAQALGAGIGAAFFAIFALWLWSRVKGKGLATSSKIKSLILANMLALGGAVMAAIPSLYSGANQLYAWMATGLVSSLRA